MLPWVEPTRLIVIRRGGARVESTDVAPREGATVEPQPVPVAPGERIKPGMSLRDVLKANGRR